MMKDRGMCYTIALDHVYSEKFSAEKNVSGMDPNVDFLVRA